MSRDNGSIGMLQLAFLFIGSTGVLNHVILIPALLDAAKRDSWIAVIFASVLFLGWMTLIYGLMKRTGRVDLIQLISRNVGRPAGWFLSGLFFLSALLKGYVGLKDTSGWLDSVILPETPYLAIVLLLAVLCWLAAFWGIKALSITSGILLPFVMLFGIFVMSGNFPKKDYSLLFPLFQQGPEPILEGMMFAGVGFSELILILGLQHHLKKPVHLFSLWFLAIFITMLTLGPLTGSIAEFGPEAASHQRYPAFEQWRILALGGFVTHVDFLSIYQWLTGTFIRVSLSLYIMGEALRIPKKKRWAGLGGLAFLLCVLSFYPRSDIVFWSLLERIVLPLSLVVSLTLGLALTFFSLLATRKNTKRTISS